MLESASQLLDSFRGDSQIDSNSIFCTSNKSKLKDIEIHAFGLNESDARFSSKWEVWKHLNVIFKINTSDGYEGVSGISIASTKIFNTDQLDEIYFLAKFLLSNQITDPLILSRLIDQEFKKINDTSLACIDIALWDLASKRALMPLYKILNGNRDSIDTYASFPFLNSLDDCILAVENHAQLGFNKFKFHGWGVLDKDIALIETIEKRYKKTDLSFMLDVEGEYCLPDALELGLRMNSDIFEWFEAPINDELLDEFSILKNKLAVPVLPDGYNSYSPEFIKEGLKKNAWDAARFDVTIVGGITKAIKLLMIISNYNIAAEIQSWGSTLSQAANLHLILANNKTKYFEVPTPLDIYQFGFKNANLVSKGSTISLKKPGLGVNIDWDILNEADYYKKIKVK